MREKEEGNLGREEKQIVLWSIVLVVLGICLFSGMVIDVLHLDGPNFIHWMIEVVVGTIAVWMVIFGVAGFGTVLDDRKQQEK